MSPNIFRFFFFRISLIIITQSLLKVATLFINIKVMKIMFVCHPHHNKSK